MSAMRSRKMVYAGFLMALAVVVAGLPGTTWADHDDDGRKHRRKHRHRQCDERVVRVVECARPVRYVQYVRPAPRVVFGFQFGTPVVQAPVRCAPDPVYYAPPACPTAPVAHGAYYDPYCDVRYANFELYLEHVNRNHAVAVSLRN